MLLRSLKRAPKAVSMVFRGTLKSHADDRETSSLGLRNDDDDAESFYDLDHGSAEDRNSIVDALKCDSSDPFQAFAHRFHCAQARTRLGSHGPGEFVCGTCSLRREGYINEPGKDKDGGFSSAMPLAFRGKLAYEWFGSSIQRRSGEKMNFNISW